MSNCWLADFAGKVHSFHCRCPLHLLTGSWIWVCRCVSAWLPGGGWMCTGSDAGHDHLSYGWDMSWNLVVKQKKRKAIYFFFTVITFLELFLSIPHKAVSKTIHPHALRWKRKKEKTPTLVLRSWIESQLAQQFYVIKMNLLAESCHQNSKFHYSTIK